MKIRVGIIFGGESVEHEVSVISALQAIKSINKEKYEVVPIYISKEKYWYTGDNLLEIENYKNLNELTNNAKEVTLCKMGNEFCLLNTRGIVKKIVDKIDVAFPIVHGKNIEDGTLAGYLETIGIPYVGSGVIGSALGQDKVILKQVLRDAKIPVVDACYFFDYEYLDNKDKILKLIDKLGYPVVVKPACLGSSVGINYVKDKKEIEDAIIEAISYDKKILVEKAVENLIEVNCSVLGNYKQQDVGVIEQVISKNDILTFSDKYESNGKKGAPNKGGMVNTDRIIPAKISDELTSTVQKYAKEAFKALNLSGVCRIDFLINSKTNEVFVNEPNIIPGSLAFYLWEPIGKSDNDVLDELIQLGIREYKENSKKVCHFDTNILKDFKKDNGIKK